MRHDLNAALFRLASIALGCVMVSAPSTHASAQAEKTSGWSRAAIIEEVNALWGLSPVEAVLAEPGAQRTLFGSLGINDCTMGGEDDLWALPARPDTVSGPLTNITMAGTGDEVHTVDIWFPIVAASAEDAERAIAVINGLVSFLLPNWERSGDWAQKSAMQSWQAFADAAQGKQITFDDILIRAHTGDARLATFGIPPDFFDFVVSTGELCGDLMPKPTE